MSPYDISSLIDLALVSDDSLVYECSAIPPIPTLGHNGQLNWKLRTQHTSRLAWCYNNSDFETACRQLNKVQWDSLLREDDVDLCSELAKQIYGDNVSLHPKSIGRKRTLPWLKKSIVQHMRERNCLF